MSSPTTLSSRWRSRAKLFRDHAGEPVARAYEKCAEELDQTWREWELEALTLDEAVEESGCSYSSLQGKVADGEIPNAGGKGKPRIRWCDLPKKGGRAQLNLQPVGAPDLAGDIILSRLGGE